MTALISPQNLFNTLDKPNLKIIDASFPAVPDFHARARIGEAVLFDIEQISDHQNPLPHMLPSPDDFGRAVGELGITNDDELVIYDQSGMAMAAARVWWMFRIFGHKNVKILDGGLPLWHALGYPLTTTPPQYDREAHPYVAQYNRHLLATRDDVLNAIGNDEIAIVDARSADRFTATAPESRPGLKTGHIPGSYNLPFFSLLANPEGTLRQNDPRVEALINSKPSRIITSCGSGVTACVLALALYESGYEDTAIYDGSWSEWALENLNLPVETGEGKKFSTSPQ